MSFDSSRVDIYATDVLGREHKIADYINIETVDVAIKSILKNNWNITSTGKYLYRENTVDIFYKACK